MNLSTVLSLATVLFKSYFRASRPGHRSPFSNPRAILILDLVLLAVPLVLVLRLLALVPPQFSAVVSSLAVQAVVGLPVILASAVIVAGILFELGQAGGIASSEAVNWLPISPVEYILASSASVGIAYSPMLFFGLGLSIPLALGSGLSSIIPLLVLSSILAFFWGAVIIEIIRATMNRISTSLYKRSGRLGAVLRVVLVVAMLVAIQIAFNPYVVLAALSIIVSGVSLAWFVPMVWPSVLIVYVLEGNVVGAAAISVLSVLFSFVILEAAAVLRARYWSPVPVTITVSPSTVYVPREKPLLWLSPVASAISSKDLKSLVRRRDMARFLAIPLILVVAPLLSIVTSGSNSRAALGAVGFFLPAEAATILPLMLASVSIGQEGRSVTNLYMLPISADDLIQGKLLLAWVISGAAIFATSLLFQLLAPATALLFLAELFTLLFTVVVQGYVGLAAGARHPNFTVGPRARYVTFTGFVESFLIGALVTVAMSIPLIMYSLTGLFASSGLGYVLPILLVMASTAVIGLVLLVVMRAYCRSAVGKLLENMEV